MKKIKMFITLTSLVLILTGCSKTLTCTYENTDGYSYKSEISIKYSGNTIKSATNKLTYEDEETAKTLYDVFKLANEKGVNVKLEGKEITITNYNKSLSANNDITTKDDLVKYLEQTKHTCK